MAILIEPNGRRTEVHPANPRKGFSLEELYKLVGCEYIECAHFGPEGKFFVLDEEGKLNGKPVNPAATRIYAQYHPDIIVGNALLCEKGEVK